MNIEKRVSQYRDNVSKIELGTKTIYLVGTAHVSKQSVDLVEEIIREIRPDTVAVELCAPRLAALKDPDRWRNTDIISVIRSGKTYVLLTQVLLAGFQKRLGEKLNIKPGAEMMKAVACAEEIGAQLLLADREIKTTLKRTWGALGFWTTTKLLTSAILGMGSSESISEEEIERLKSSDALDSLLQEFSQSLPEVRTTLIDERDLYMAAKLADAPGTTIVSVIGAGHGPGILRTIGEPIDLAALETLPPPGLVSKLFTWGLPLMVIGFILYGFFGMSASIGWEMAKSWILITGGSAALGSLLCLAHPLTIIAAFISAPITTLHPLLASGWIAGLVEAMLRKPRVADLEALSDDVSSVKGLWTNRFSRVLLIVALTNLAGSVGMIWGAKVLAFML